MALIDQPTTLFPVPFAIHYFGEQNSDLNSNLVKDIITEKNVDPEGTNRSNIGGWHSAFGMNGKYESFHSLSKIIEDYGNRFCNTHGFYDGLKFSNMWANINLPGDMNAPHHHGTDPLTGVYYPVESVSGDHDEVLNFDYDTDKIPLGINNYDSNREDPGGALVFQDPAYGKKTTLVNKTNPDNCSSYHVYPKAGLLMLFPGYITHYVTPFKENKKRLSISFSLRYGTN